MLACDLPPRSWLTGERDRPNAGRPRPGPQPSILTTRRGTRPRVLVVEDEALVAWDLGMTVQSFGCELCSTAATAADAVRLAREHRPDLVLMDIHLRGETDGLSAADAIRAESPVPVLFITAYADAGTRAQAERRGCRLLLKPIRHHELFQAMKRELAAGEDEPSD